MRVSIFISRYDAIIAHLYVYLEFVLRRAVKIAREVSKYILMISKFCAYFRYLRNMMHINLRKLAVGTLKSKLRFSSVRGKRVLRSIRRKALM